MKIGISTASLFARVFTEDALELLSKNNVETAEVCLESFREYNAEFGKLLNTKKGNTDINSIHVLTTQIEPQLYSLNQRAMEDSFDILEGVLACGKEIGAKNYTFHGVGKFKKIGGAIDYDRVGSITQRIIDRASKYNINLAYENVHWCYYNYIGFFEEIRKRTVGLKGTLDIKQARLSDIHYSDFIKEMKGDIVTVHLSDVNGDGKMCLPGKGITDFYDIFSRLKDVGFDGALLLEVYQNDYKEYSELFESLDYVKNMAERVFK